MDTVKDALANSPMFNKKIRELLYKRFKRKGAKRKKTCDIMCLAEMSHRLSIFCGSCHTAKIYCGNGHCNEYFQHTGLQLKSTKIFQKSF
jgi:hypothetical protein